MMNPGGKRTADEKSRPGGSKVDDGLIKSMSLSELLDYTHADQDKVSKRTGQKTDLRNLAMGSGNQSKAQNNFVDLERRLELLERRSSRTVQRIDQALDDVQLRVNALADRQKIGAVPDKAVMSVIDKAFEDLNTLIAHEDAKRAKIINELEHSTRHLTGRVARAEKRTARALSLMESAVASQHKTSSEQKRSIEALRAQFHALTDKLESGGAPVGAGGDERLRLLEKNVQNLAAVTQQLEKQNGRDGIPVSIDEQAKTAILDRISQTEQRSVESITSVEGAINDIVTWLDETQQEQKTVIDTICDAVNDLSGRLAQMEVGGPAINPAVEAAALAASVTPPVARDFEPEPVEDLADTTAKPALGLMDETPDMSLEGDEPLAAETPVEADTEGRKAPPTPDVVPPAEVELAKARQQFAEPARKQEPLEDLPAAPAPKPEKVKTKPSKSKGSTVIAGNFKPSTDDVTFTTVKPKNKLRQLFMRGAAAVLVFGLAGGGLYWATETQGGKEQSRTFFKETAIGQTLGGWALSLAEKSETLSIIRPASEPVAETDTVSQGVSQGGPMILLPDNTVLDAAPILAALDEKLMPGDGQAPEARTLDLLRATAEAGEPQAQFIYARALEIGHLVTQNPGEAVHWYERAAARGIDAAHFVAGLRWQQGAGGDADATKAVRHYQAAADAGYAPAMHALAVSFAKGEGVAQDFAAAATWFKAAAERNILPAKVNYAFLSQHGFGIEANTVEALKWYTIAAASGDEGARAARDFLASSAEISEIAASRQLARIWQPQLDGPAFALNTLEAGDLVDLAFGAARLQASTLLEKIGYPIDPTTGGFGPVTRESIRSFERNMQLPVSGDVSPMLLQQLAVHAR